MLSLAEQLGMPIFTDLSNLQVSKDRFKQIPYAFAKKHVVLPIKEDEKSVLIAVADPLNLTPIEELRFLAELRYRSCLLLRVMSFFPPSMIAITQKMAPPHRLIANLTDKNDDGRGEEVEVFDLLDQGPPSIADHSTAQSYFN